MCCKRIQHLAQFCIAVLFLFLSPFQAKGGEPFRFIELTDIHINAKETSAIEDLRHTVDQINASDSIDFILVTGDIADEGDRASLLEAKKELDRLKRPYYIVMGNHDQKWSESGCMDFKNIFGYERFKLVHKGYLFLGFGCGPMMRMALGHVSPEDIEWLKQELAKNGKDGLPIFLVTHIPMLPQDMDNWFEVTDAVRPYPVKAFINGHYHTNHALVYDGIPGLTNIANLRLKGQPYGQYNEYDITPDSMIIYTHPVGSPRYRWAGISLTHHYYDEKPGSYNLRPDYSINRKYPQVQETWTVRSHAAIFSSPVVYHNRVYTVDDLGNVNCYTLKDGRLLWSNHTHGRLFGTPDIGQDILVAGSADNRIYGIDASNGKLRWQLGTRRPVVSAVTIDKGVAYIGASDSTFRAIRVKDGKLIWQANGINGYVETRPLVTQDKVIFGAWDNTLYALNKKDGTLAWKWVTCADKGMHYSPAAVWPVTAHGKVFIVDPERAMTAIDLKTGKQLWRTYRSKVRESIGLSADKKRIYAKTMQDSIVCYSAESDSPQELWATDVGFGYEHATVMLPEKDGQVFSSTKNGLIFALDAFTGQLLWSHKIENTLVNTVVPINRKEVVYTNEDGWVGKLVIP
ncbi:PQQ-binding-like beta-propeller repeat protein [Prevotella cerevisiae]|uniref:PQQ-binding-like beta-propeller repeat protein n=1 Tax=Segatella cerevisiae TaxID=2053716 RepID=A0ABT1BW75_9BACT|nr:PQQ-binding-like beta-propeller repeat protein [Segatella cerevisiae]MCO6025219.1 PQQ-binding-like beta-propeller repeat protein [Segatella cerevisiae]